MNLRNFYNIYYPELTIEVKRDVDDDRLVPEFYAFAMTNHHTSYETLNIKCQQTILESYQIVVLDGGRLSVPTPTWGKVIYEDNRFHKKYDYKYYEKDNLTFKVFKFLYDQKTVIIDSHYGIIKMLFCSMNLKKKERILKLI